MREAHWQAPEASGPVDATMALPGSKSLTNRALLLAALADGETVLRGPLRSRDSTLMVAGLRSLGATIDDAGQDWRVRPGPLRGGGAIDVGNAGTVLRFLPPVAALADGDVRFDGDARARERPLAPLVAGLRAVGADISDGGRGAVPLTIRARGRVPGGPAKIDASGSSQLVSGLLLAAPGFDEGIELRHEGPRLPSQPHIAMTAAVLREAGVQVGLPAPGVWHVAPGTPRGGEREIEPDLSNAAPFLAAALVTGGTVRVPGWPKRTTQPGDILRSVLGAMGADVAPGPEGLTVRGTGELRGIDADLHDSGELAPTVAALAALADSPSRLSGIAHLRRHETDRLDALARELTALGGDVTQSDDGLEIRPRRLRGGVFHTYDDHRLATAAAVLGLVVPGIEVENVATTAKTLPDFTGRWSRMLGGRGESGQPGNSGEPDEPGEFKKPGTAGEHDHPRDEAGAEP